MIVITLTVTIALAIAISGYHPRKAEVAERTKPRIGKPVRDSFSRIHPNRRPSTCIAETFPTAPHYLIWDFR